MRVVLPVAVLVMMLGVVPVRRADAQPAAGAAGAGGAAELSNESLKVMLDGLGLAPKVLSKGFLIAVKRDDWTFNVQLVISGDGTKVGLNANLGQVEKPETVTADQWKALLMSNEDIDPSFFYFDGDLKKVMLHRVLDNRGITAEVLQAQIEAFVRNIKNTEKVWSFAK